MVGSPSKPLSEREQQVIELASQGLTDDATAHRLGISAGTVATYWLRIRTKYGGHARTELVALAVKSQYEVEINRLKEMNDTLVHSLRRMDVGDTQGNPSDFYHEVLDSAGEAILVVDTAGTIVWSNQASDSLFGYDHAELEGKSVALLVPDRFKKVHGQHIKDFFASPVTHKMAENMTPTALCKNGEEVEIASTVASVSTGGKPLVVCTVCALSPVAALQRTGRHGHSRSS